MKIKSIAKVDLFNHQSCYEYVHGKERKGGNAVMMIADHLYKKYGGYDLTLQTEIALLQNALVKLFRLIKLRQKQLELVEKGKAKWQL